jgi:hypothetical protein
MEAQVVTVLPEREVMPAVLVALALTVTQVEQCTLADSLVRVTATYQHRKL